MLETGYITQIDLVSGKHNFLVRRIVDQHRFARWHRKPFGKHGCDLVGRGPEHRRLRDAVAEKQIRHPPARIPFDIVENNWTVRLDDQCAQMVAFDGFGHPKNEILIRLDETTQILGHYFPRSVSASRMIRTVSDHRPSVSISESGAQRASETSSSATGSPATHSAANSTSV